MTAYLFLRLGLESKEAAPRLLMNKVRFAVAGTGNIIREFHLPALLQNSRVEVIGAANLHPESLEALSRNFQITKTYTNFDLLAEDSNRATISRSSKWRTPPAF